MKYINYIRIISLVTLLSISVSDILFAQGPYNYNTPLDKKIYGAYFYTNTHSINPQEWGSSASGYDGLTIRVNFNWQGGVDYQLFGFTNKHSERFLEVFCKDKTLIFRRYNPNMPGRYYDYILYDPLFIKSNSNYWDIRLYFTGFFFWAQVASENGNYLSPVYFGVNALHRKNMEDFIDAAPKSNIFVGDGRYPGPANISLVEVYAFHYNELVKDIDAKFSWPGEWGLYDFGPDPNEEEY